MPRALRGPFPAAPVPTPELHTDARATWPRMFADAARAKKRLWIENYILEDGEAAEALLKAVQQARANGAEVRLLFDDFGSMFLSREFEERLEATGAEFRRYNPVHWLKMPWVGVSRYARRTHRRILIVDQELVWTGGIAISDRWWAKDDGSEIHDAMLRVEGELVGQFALAFDELWSGERLPTPVKYPAARPGEGRCLVQHPGRGWRLNRELRRTIADAHGRVWLATPYFIPPRKLRRALRYAAKAGVDVRLLLPGPARHDHPAVRFAARRYYYRLLRAGIRIYEYQPSFQHAKVALFNEAHTVIGSANLDRWSWLHNHEIMIGMHCQDLADRVSTWFLEKFEQSEEIVIETWVKRSLRARLAERFFGLFDRWF
jgi:phosphatidylserine/phosphatidylglycerophosphate/cardiolipin synthase-like enzyme